MGHGPIHISDGIKVDYHFFQEFFPTYASESEFCAGFDISSDIPGFTPSCPECSMCKSDGTDKKCMEHSSGNACEMAPGCIYNNMTQQCHSLLRLTPLFLSSRCWFGSSICSPRGRCSAVKRLLMLLPVPRRALQASSRS